LVTFVICLFYLVGGILYSSSRHTKFVVELARQSDIETVCFRLKNIDDEKYKKDVEKLVQAIYSANGFVTDTSSLPKKLTKVLKRALYV
jgi:nitric oxide reductase activation protein